MPLARTNVFPGSPVLQEAHSVTACPLFSLLPEELKFIPKGGSYLGFVLFLGSCHLLYLLSFPSSGS